MKHKHDEKEIISQAEKAAQNYLKQKANLNVHFKDYMIDPTNTLHLYGVSQKKDKVVVLVNRQNGKFIIESYGYYEDKD
ncbi:ribosomal protein S15P/S13E [Scopulibacillus daqui]|uniref:Ribosomal protein S15P/S13E n=1 Tax=Scopulibacillus daqui TaxID=1469162 RepID=A0ABS2PYF6_9BACL|nr:hypothetical protein [Scopulibacillus daqui]MBM7645072.1 ribosomal protein S15P/S13E [Scopulibacillus daqui]